MHDSTMRAYDSAVRDPQHSQVDARQVDNTQREAGKTSSATLTLVQSESGTSIWVRWQSGMFVTFVTGGRGKKHNHPGIQSVSSSKPPLLHAACEPRRARWPSSEKGVLGTCLPRESDHPAGERRGAGSGWLHVHLAQPPLVPLQHISQGPHLWLSLDRSS